MTVAESAFPTQALPVGMPADIDSILAQKARR
jgi:hypothetical protein